MKKKQKNRGRSGLGAGAGGGVATRLPRSLCSPSVLQNLNRGLSRGWAGVTLASHEGKHAEREEKKIKLEDELFTIYSIYNAVPFLSLLWDDSFHQHVLV